MGLKSKCNMYEGGIQTIYNIYIQSTIYQQIFYQGQKQTMQKKTKRTRQRNFQNEKTFLRFWIEMRTEEKNRRVLFLIIAS